MKQKKRVIAPSSLPTKIPLWPTIVLYLLLEQQSATDLVKGVVYTLLVIWWVVAIYNSNREESRDVPGFGDF